MKSIYDLLQELAPNTMVDITTLPKEKLLGYIMEDPNDFTLCSGCDKIIVNGARFCPFCNSYKFLNITDVLDINSLTPDTKYIDYFIPLE